MTHWWTIVTVPGWIASKITQFPETNAVASYRSMKRFTDNSIEIVENKTGKTHTRGIKVISSNDSPIEKYGITCKCCKYETDYTRTTCAELAFVNTVYWTTHLPEGDIEIHKTTHDEQDKVSWTLEMWGDPDNFIKLIQKQISR
jgi:hypothetical protein